MQNIIMEISENILTIKIDMTKTIGPSNSGKTEMIATTKGNKGVPAFPDCKIGINCYRKKV